jgi:hypothetical protein
VEQKMFVENLALLIVKNHLSLQFVETVWLKCLVLQLCLHVQFLFQKLYYVALPKLVEKIKETYVFPLLYDYCCATTSFDLWMSKGAHDVFAFFWDLIGNQNKLLLVCLKPLKLHDKHWL